MAKCKGKECEWYAENIGEQGESDCILITLYGEQCIYCRKKKKETANDKLKIWLNKL